MGGACSSDKNTNPTSHRNTEQTPASDGSSSSSSGESGPAGPLALGSAAPEHGETPEEKKEIGTPARMKSSGSIDMPRRATSTSSIGDRLKTWMGPASGAKRGEAGKKRSFFIRAMTTGLKDILPVGTPLREELESASDSEASKKKEDIQFEENTRLAQIWEDTFDLVEELEKEVSRARHLGRRWGEVRTESGKWKDNPCPAEFTEQRCKAMTGKLETLCEKYDSIAEAIEDISAELQNQAYPSRHEPAAETSEETDPDVALALNGVVDGMKQILNDLCEPRLLIYQLKIATIDLFLEIGGTTLESFKRASLDVPIYLSEHVTQLWEHADGIIHRMEGSLNGLRAHLKIEKVASNDSYKILSTVHSMVDPELKIVDEDCCEMSIAMLRQTRIVLQNANQLALKKQREKMGEGLVSDPPQIIGITPLAASAPANNERAEDGLPPLSAFPPAEVLVPSLQANPQAAPFVLRSAPPPEGNSRGGTPNFQLATPDHGALAKEAAREAGTNPLEALRAHVSPGKGAGQTEKGVHGALEDLKQSLENTDDEATEKQQQTQLDPMKKAKIVSTWYENEEEDTDDAHDAVAEAEDAYAALYHMDDDVDAGKDVKDVTKSPRTPSKDDFGKVANIEDAYAAMYYENDKEEDKRQSLPILDTP